jgi:hypothetical protein
MLNAMSRLYTSSQILDRQVHTGAANLSCAQQVLPEYYPGSIHLVKLSVSLSDDDVAVLDAYVEKAGLPSRSAGLQRAIRMLRYPTLEDDYDDAWSEWAATGEAEVWEETVGDGLGNAAR